MQPRLLSRFLAAGSWSKPPAVVPVIFSTDCMILIMVIKDRQNHGQVKGRHTLWKKGFGTASQLALTTPSNGHAHAAPARIPPRRPAGWSHLDYALVAIHQVEEETAASGLQRPQSSCSAGHSGELALPAMYSNNGIQERPMDRMMVPVTTVGKEFIQSAYAKEAGRNGDNSAQELGAEHAGKAVLGLQSE